MSKPAFEMLCSLWRVLFWYQCGRIQLLGPNLVRLVDLRPSLMPRHVGAVHLFHTRHTGHKALADVHIRLLIELPHRHVAFSLSSRIYTIPFILYIWYVSGHRRTQTTSFHSNETFTTIKF